ncbi:MAG TPA: hypothetical protein VE690_09195 [Rhodopila sp.]|nr:hypothetical protein [Rhodopila sp.]
MPRHLLIAGTGRAGTSFLVRYLAGMGLETHLSRAGANPLWDEAAQAGLEDLPVPGRADLPYVIKSPWTYQVIHEALGSGRLELDAAVIPVRDLTEAACSRSIIEMRSVRRQLPWLGEMDRTWEEFGHTPGGIVYSLNPTDQARLLALGLHRLLEALVSADVPIVLLSFPRLIEDADYLFRKLSPLLPAGSTPDAARRVHTAVADPAKVRVGGDLQGDDPAPADGLVMEGAGPLRLERAVLARMLAEARRELAEVQARLAAAEASARDAQAAREAEAAQGQRAQSALAAMAEARDQAVARARSAEDALHVLQRAAAQRQPGAAGIAGLRRRVADLARRQWAALRLRWVNRRGRQAAE